MTNNNITFTNRLVGLINIILGASFLVVGVVFLALIPVFDNNHARIAFIAIGSSFSFSGLVMLVIGVAFYVAVYKKQVAKLARLKQDGARFSATIIKIRHRITMQVGRHMSARAECEYTNSDGKVCLVISDSFLADPNATYGADVYVNLLDASDYAVEIYNQELHHQSNYDFDYRKK